MRYIIITLLLANIAFFSWQQLAVSRPMDGQPEAGSRSPNRPLINTGLLKVGEEVSR